MNCYYTVRRKAAYMSNAKLIHMQKGLGLATAIFVITVMAILSVLIAQLVSNNAETTQEEIELIRAFYSAETGIQFGLNALFPPGAPPAAACSTDFPKSYELLEGGLSRCDASVSCESVTVSAVEYFTLTSTGTCGEVNRTIQVRAQ